MTSQNDVLSQKLNLADPIDGEFYVPNKSLLPVPTVGEEGDKEYEENLNHAHQKLKNIIEQSHDLAEIVMKQVLDSQSPRVLETIPNLLKSLAELNREFVSVSEKKHLLKTLERDEASTSSLPSVQNNAIFVGSSEELFKLLGNKK